MRSRLRLLAPVAALAALLAVAACGGQSDARDGGSPVADVQVHDDDGLHGIVLPEPYHVPEATLTATSGAPYRLAADTGAPLTLVFFGYTHCPDVCPLVMANLASALTRLDDAQRAQVEMLFVTTDPARDDAAALREYLDRFDPSFEGLTGQLRRIVAAGKTLGVAIQKGERLASGGYEVGHGTQVIGVLPDGTAPVVWTAGTSPAELADDVATILGEGIPQTGGAQ